MDNVSFVRFLIVSAVSSYYLSKILADDDAKKGERSDSRSNPFIVFARPPISVPAF